MAWRRGHGSRTIEGTLGVGVGDTGSFEEVVGLVHRRRHDVVELEPARVVQLLEHLRGEAVAVGVHEHLLEEAPLLELLLDGLEVRAVERAVADALEQYANLAVDVKARKRI